MLTVVRPRVMCLRDLFMKNLFMKNSGIKNLENRTELLTKWKLSFLLKSQEILAISGLFPLCFSIAHGIMGIV